MNEPVSYFREVWKEFWSVEVEYKSLPENNIYERFTFTECEKLVAHNIDIMDRLNSIFEELTGRLHTLPPQELDALNAPLDDGEPQSSLATAFHVMKYLGEDLGNQIELVERWRSSIK
ncbi:hypothetical protein NGC52_23505 [Klebsiella michiganensis]|uniref:hypothetical protein n=1 Tax=Klebsiella michiganensis TaxID=1134687 RepID=UPI002DB85A44|nr:hypothetical protein [Klebsiella michiganensis]MEB7682703.1 hypothetical protein [Klebsiella michiganensis]